MSTKKEDIIVGSNETQKRIFKAIFNRPLTRPELSIMVNVKEKTVANNLPILEREVNNVDSELAFVRYFNDKNQPLYLVSKRPVQELKLKPKLFNMVLARKRPYAIINLPSPPTDSMWKLYALSCLHYGASTCNYKMLGKFIDSLAKEENALIVLLGDLMENATRDSIGDGVYRQVIPPHEQKTGVAKLLSKVAHKILYIHRGNHSARSVKAVDQDPERDIADLLQVPYFIGPAYIDLVCQNHLWTMCSFHGKSSSNTIGGRINATQKRSLWHSAMINLVGHYHDTQVVKDIEVVKDRENLTLEYMKRYYVLAGSFMEYWNSYAEEASYPPLDIGIPKVLLYCDGSSKPGDYWATDN